MVGEFSEIVQPFLNDVVDLPQVHCGILVDQDVPDAHHAPDRLHKGRGQNVSFPKLVETST